MAWRWPSDPIVLLERASALVLSLPLALACNPDEVPPLPVVPPERAIYSEGNASSGECSVAFSPDEALLLYVEQAAERWSLATGCDVFVGAGIPVELAPSILRPDGTEAPGMTSEARDLVLINAQSRELQRARTVLHELGHALGGDHTLTNGVLSGQKGHGYLIDAAALDTVCSRLACRLLSPEVPDHGAP